MLHVGVAILCGVKHSYDRDFIRQPVDFIDDDLGQADHCPFVSADYAPDVTNVRP